MTMRTAITAGLFTAAFATLSPTAASAQSCTGAHTPGAARLTVEATGLRNGNGEVAFTVYANDSRKFLAKGGKLLRARVPAAAPLTQTCFWLPPGIYEVAQYHDENADHDFNRTLFVPKEGFGFSNDASTTLGLPSMKDTQFTLPASGRTVRMKMRYRR
jgi:uncharacterized protein (DUF2141 family)